MRDRQHTAGRTAELDELRTEPSRRSAASPSRCAGWTAHEGSGGLRLRNTLYHPIELIAEAARGHHRFEHWVAKPLEDLSCRFDLKYWPSLDDLLRALARDAACAEVVATDPLTAAATLSGRPSRADVFRAFFADLEDERLGCEPSWPEDFRPTDATVAALMNCALDLGPDEMVGAEYVKGLRQRDRARTSR